MHHLAGEILSVKVLTTLNGSNPKGTGTEYNKVRQDKYGAISKKRGHNEWKKIMETWETPSGKKSKFTIGEIVKQEKYGVINRRLIS